jgi:hypothetical protein
MGPDTSAGNTHTPLLDQAIGATPAQLHGQGRERRAEYDRLRYRLAAHRMDQAATERDGGASSAEVQRAVEAAVRREREWWQATMAAALREERRHHRQELEQLERRIGAEVAGILPEAVRGVVDQLLASRNGHPARRVP